MGLIDTVKWLVNDVGTSKVLPNAAFDGEDFWAGPDDLWPEEPATLQAVAEAEDERPEIITTPQWGLILPGGEIMWNSWQGIDFDHPLGRLRMVATLQKTALEMGFAPEQVSEFTASYSWATRMQVAAVIYESTGEHALTDQIVSASPDDSESVHNNEKRETP